MLDMVIGPARANHIAPDSLRSKPPSLKERLEPIRFSDDGPRVFDARLGCWLALVSPEAEVEAVREAAPIPYFDNSGVFWNIWDDQMGVILWKIEARDFPAALREKRRLCQCVGGRSGWAHLERDLTP